VQLGNVVLAVQRGALSRSPDGTPLTFSAAPPSLDLGAMVLGLFAADGVAGPASTSVSTLELLSSQGSALEGESLTQALGGEHLTAVGFLTRAVREGQTLTRVDATNVEPALAAAELSSDAEASVRVGVGQGLIAWISQTQLPFDTWDTTGYVLEDPATGAGGYFVTFERLVQGLEANIVFHSPQDLDEVTAPLDVVATLDGEEIESWTLAYRAADGGSAVELASGTGTFANATLARFDPTLLLNGLYDIVLTARDSAGQSASEKISVAVEGQMKIGNFNLSFSDLSVPLAGLDVEVVRTYDSRDKAQRDFGVGWALDVRRGSYVNNRVPGDGWQIRSGFLPCQAAVESKSHLTTVRLSDLEIYRYALRLTSLAPTFGGCFATASFTFIDGLRPGATLEILGNASVFYGNGSDRLIDTDSFDLYEPRQVRLTTPDGRIFDLDLEEGVTRLEDLNGNALSITAAGITHTSGQSIAFERDAEGRITRITDPLGQALVYEYDAAGDLVSVTDRNSDLSQFVYLADHFLAEVIDSRGVRATRSEYDDAGRLVKVIDASGSEIAFDRDLSARREVVTDRLGNARIIEYDGRGNIVRQTDATGATIVRTFDAQDNVFSEADGLGDTTFFTWSPSNDLISIRDPLGSETSLTYDVGGRVLTMTDAGVVVIRNTYGARGNLLSTTDPSGAVTRFTYDAAGNVVTETDPLGQVTTNDYDNRGYLVRQVDPLGVETTFTYNALGDLLTEMTTRTTVAGIETLVKSFRYDGAGRITGRTLPNGTTITTVYDANGNVIENVDRLGRSTQFSYDERNNLVATTFPDGTTETRTYDAEDNLISLTDRGGRTTAFAYDATSRGVRTTFPDGAFTTTQYDGAGRIVARTDERGNTMAFAFDAAGREVARSDALGHTTTTTYDALGRQQTSTDPAGNVTSWEYDDAGRITLVVFSDGSDRRMAFDAAGRMISETDPAGLVTHFAYDGKGRLVEVTDALGGITRFEVDEQGNRISQTDANGNVTRWEHDAIGRATKRILPDGLVETITYDAVGNVTAKSDFAGRTIHQVYDVNDRLLEQVFPDDSRVTFTYTATGRRATVVDARGTTSYTYDSRDRLTSVMQPDGRRLTYTYDAAGNRTSMTAGVAGQSLTTTYSYDALNRLTTVTDPDGESYAHAYDANGNRAALVYPNGVSTSYTYDSAAREVEILQEERILVIHAVGHRREVYRP